MVFKAKKPAMPLKVVATDAALQLIKQLQQMHGPLMFHQSGGCCDGSQPMCFAEGEFKIGEIDICLGEVADCKFYISKDQYEYWKHTQLILDVSAGRGSSFSLEIPLGVRFLTKSRVFSEDELKALALL